MSDKEFKSLHVSFLKKHNAIKWFLVSPFEGLRGRWFFPIVPNVNGMNVLDLCGAYGAFGAYLQATKGLRFNYTCLDANKHIIGLGPAYFKEFGLKEPNFIIHNIKKPLPFEVGEFDMIWLFGWCDPLFDCNRLFKEIHKVLRPNGMFIFSMAVSTADYKTRYTESELRKLLKETRFIIDSLSVIDHSKDFGVIVRKKFSVSSTD